MGKTWDKTVPVIHLAAFATKSDRNADSILPIKIPIADWLIRDIPQPIPQAWHSLFHAPIESHFALLPNVLAEDECEVGKKSQRDAQQGEEAISGAGKGWKIAITNQKTGIYRHAVQRKITSYFWQLLNF